MNETNFFRKYIDIINEAPATAINPNDKNAAAFGKQINQTPAAGNRPGGIAFNQDAPAQSKTQVGSNSVQQNPANVDVAATKARDRLQQKMASGKIATPAPQTVDPNQQYGGGYDPNKVKYATGPAVNNQSSGYTAQSQAQNTLKATQPNAQSPTFTGMAGSAAQQPSLASQYVAANQPQASTQQQANPSKPTAPEPSLASQYVSANQPQTVAEEDDDGDDDLLKSIIRLIKK
jgi:hypothetical protein